MILEKGKYYELKQEKEIYVYEIAERYEMQYVFCRIIDRKLNHTEYNIYRNDNFELSEIESMDELYEVMEIFTNTIPNTKEFMDYFNKIY